MEAVDFPASNAVVCTLDNEPRVSGLRIPMLVLKRCINESIIIDESVEVYVVGLSPQDVDFVILGLPSTRVQKITLWIRETVNVFRDVSVMLIEQNVKAALRISDRAYILAEGRNQIDGSPQELMDGQVVAEIYLGGRRLKTS